MSDPNSAFLIVNGKRISLSAFLAMDKAAVETVDARGCTGLTELNAANAKTVDASGCTGLTELNAANAKTVDARGCTGLTELNAANAEFVYASGCTGLTGWEIIDAGADARGYSFSAVKIRGEWRIVAGCRNFAPEDALRHWGPSGASSRPDCLDLVRKIVAEIARREPADVVGVAI